jgi:hypothetical protein
MRSKTIVAAAVIALVAFAPAGWAEDKKEKPAVSGTWAKKDGQLKIEFVDKEVVKFYPHGDNEFVVVCKYSINKDGSVKATAKLGERVLVKRFARFQVGEA